MAFSDISMGKPYMTIIGNVWQVKFNHLKIYVNNKEHSMDNRKW